MNQEREHDPLSYRIGKPLALLSMGGRLMLQGAAEIDPHLFHGIAESVVPSVLVGCSIVGAGLWLYGILARGK